ncbi:MAG: hypothetical protein C4527_23460 [Candidatus Omnitrophota bacterium]|jgi:capsular polysaccharide biosynthesis protein|nr:MAG: hypothetical protein C4527_23460 [Candidatus Omnitrophota bacterium]
MAVVKEINLSAIFNVMWERGKRIFLFTFVVMIVGAICTLFIHNRYGATAILVMNKSKLGERIMAYPAHPIFSYPPLLLHNSVLQYLMEKYELDKSPYKFDYPEELGARLGVDIIMETSLMKIYVELENATTAANLVNELATKAIEYNQQIMENEKKASNFQLSVEVESVSSTVKTLSDQYLITMKKNLKPLVINELNTYNATIATLRQELETLKSSIVELENQVIAFEDIFPATTAFDLIIPTQRFIFEDNVMLETYRKTHPDFDIKSMEGLTFTAESVNPGYLELQREYKKLKVDLVARKERSIYLDERIQTLVSESKEYQHKIFEMDMEEMLLKADLDRGLEIFSGIDKQERWASTTVTTERQDLYLVHPATPSKKKVFPRRSLIVAVIGAIAFLLSFLYYLLIDLYGLMDYDKEEKIAPAASD